MVTSSALPQPDQDRLRDLIAPLPQVRLVVSDADNVSDALVPTLEAIRGSHPALVQFRIDDDDAVSADYIARLADFARRMRGYGPFSYCRPRGLVLSAYAEADPQPFVLDQAFHSMGTAVCLKPQGRTIFNFGHFALQGRFPSFLDNTGHGFLALKLPGHDSDRVDAQGRPPRGLQPISQEDFAAHLARDFPGLDGAALMTWLADQRPAPS